MPKLTQTNILKINGIIFGLFFTFSIYQVLGWNLFPWVNLSIISGATLICLIFGMIVKIQSMRIKNSIIIVSGIEIIISSILLMQTELLRNQWQWIFFPITLIFCLIFWDLFSRRNHQIQFLGRISCLILLILTFLKFINAFSNLNNLIMATILWISCLLIFSGYKSEKSKH
jgi:hypothetical protein